MDFIVDEYGVLRSNENSNGDSAHHSMFYCIMRSILDPAQIPAGEVMLEKFAKDGGFARHPIRETNDFSRDQFTPFLAYNSMFLNGQNQHVNDYYKKIMANGGIFFNSHDSGGTVKEWWNRDWMDPATRGLYLRGQKDFSYKLWLTDFHQLTGVIFRIIQVRNEPDSTADENLQLHLLTAALKHPTFISKFSAKIYFKYRPDNRGGRGWRGSILDFWSRNGTYFPGIVAPAIAAIEKVFGKDI